MKLYIYIQILFYIPRAPRNSILEHQPPNKALEPSKTKVIFFSAHRYQTEVKIPEEPLTVHTSQVENKLDLKGFSIMHLNIASLIKHIDQLRTILLEKPCHILSINETRLSENIDDGMPVECWDPR